VLEGLFEGLAAGCGRGIAIDMKPAAGGKPPFVWSIADRVACSGAATNPCA
jgi:hypothetical protein